MKIVIAGINHETNSFSPFATGLETFGRVRVEPGPGYGPQAEDAFRTTPGRPAAAFIDWADALGHSFVTPIAAAALPSKPATQETYEALVTPIVDAVADGCDAVLLELHGGMIAEGIDDAEGELLRRIRSVRPDVPVVATLDSHANLSPNFFRNVTFASAYRTYPHVDMRTTGERALRIFERTLSGEVEPVVLWRRLPMITHMNRQTELQQPMKDIMARAVEASTSGEVLDASLLGGFPLGDTPWAGLTVLIIADRAQLDRGRRLLDELAQMAWSRRADFVFHSEPIETSIARAATLPGPVVLADHGDNTGAGGPTDDMTVLAEVLRQGLEDLLAGPICDPEAVEQMVTAGEGATLTLDIGGKVDSPAIGRRGQPLRLTGTVRRITDGCYTVTGPMFTGSVRRLGRTAVFDIGQALIVVTERRTEPSDTGVFTHAGIDPAQKHFVLLKSRQHFRAGFGPIAKHVVMVAGPGVCTSDYDSLPFRRIPRPIYPFDTDIIHDPLRGMDPESDAL